MRKSESIFSDPYSEERVDKRLLDEISEVKIVEVSPSTEIGYLLLNRHLLGEERPVVAIGGFLADLTSVGRAYEGLCLAELNRPVLMLDMPGHGWSTPHSLKQIYDLCLRRNLDSQAEPLTEAVLKLLSTEDSIDYFGISHGALLSIKMTEQDPTDRVNDVFGIDLPAVKSRWTVGMMMSYIFTDNFVARRRYFEEIEGSDYARDFSVFERQFVKLDIPKAKSFIVNNPGLFICNLIASVDARPIALNIWSKIMEEKSTSIRVATAEASNISDYRAIEAFIASLTEEHQRRSQQTVVKGADHNIGMCHLMPRSAAWAQKAYNQQKTTAAERDAVYIERLQ